MSPIFTVNIEKTFTTVIDKKKKKMFKYVDVSNPRVLTVNLRETVIFANSQTEFLKFTVKIRLFYRIRIFRYFYISSSDAPLVYNL